MRVFKSIYKFYDKNIDYYSASLSFFTIFAFVPILTVILYAFSTVGLMDKLHLYILALLEIILPNYEYLQEYLEAFFNFDTSIGVTSSIYIIIVAFLFVRDYKDIVSKILGTKKNLTSSILFYFNHIILAPILIFLYLFAYQYFDMTLLYNPIIFILLFIFYLFSIEDRNKQSIFLIFKISIFIGFLWEIIKNIYFVYTIYNKAYYTLYGSLSAIFFLLLWIYISWIIFLYGLRYYKLKYKTTSTTKN